MEHKHNMQNRIAIIDMGTNTFHLLVAEWQGERYQFIHRQQEAVKLGMGGINQGTITEAAAIRALTTLKKFAASAQHFNVKIIQAFGTSALRSATNGPEIIERIKNETGLEATIISGDEEAEYIYFGVRSALALGKEKSLIMDIGGGSVEFIIANESGISWRKSFDIGGQRLLEKFHRHDPILQREINELNIYFDEILRPLFENMNHHNPLTLVGSSGTFDTLSEMYCINNNLPWQADDPETPLTLHSFQETFEQLIAKNREERMEMNGMIEMRVDMIVVACCLIQFILNRNHFQRIRVSSYSLKEGILASIQK
jgi:exopolyphosphatase/guanosine-5'-triphosphate,3'-diphosphate pyrophosphatase